MRPATGARVLMSEGWTATGSMLGAAGDFGGSARIGGDGASAVVEGRKIDCL
jgi:hypothetical protein